MSFARASRLSSSLTHAGRQDLFSLKLTPLRGSRASACVVVIGALRNEIPDKVLNSSWILSLYGTQSVGQADPSAARVCLAIPPDVPFEVKDTFATLAEEITHIPS